MPSQSEITLDRETMKLLLEIGDRARRTETRVTKVANHLGVDAGEQSRPVMNDRGDVDIKTPKTSIEDILAAIPTSPTYDEVDVYCNGERIATLLMP